MPKFLVIMKHSLILAADRESYDGFRRTPKSLSLLVDRPNNEKADVAERPKAFRHVGLLINGPPGLAGLPFIQSSDITYITYIVF